MVLLPVSTQFFFFLWTWKNFDFFLSPAKTLSVFISLSDQAGNVYFAGDAL